MEVAGFSMYKCPVCSYPYLEEDPAGLTYEICPSCGTEFGYDEPDDYPELTQKWIDNGGKFWSDFYNQATWRPHGS